MDTSEVQALIEAGLPDAEVTVTGDGSHFQALVVSDAFEGKSLVAKQKMVYATVNEAITSGELHAFTIKAYTPAEWEKARKLQVGAG
ncbi:MAG TPA: BolA family transcriptional regulator [Gammaproteobacteria bacterium]|nr:BolA family transcriptional regulator [Gammaproteobacteria bacterium]